MATSKEDTRSIRLRDWYLARLRKRAFAGTRDLTPVTLIEADKQFIEALIADTATQAAEVTENVPVRFTPFEKWIAIAWTVATLICAATTAAFENDATAAVTTVFQLTAGMILVQGPPAAYWSSAGVQLLLPLCFFGIPFLASVYPDSNSPDDHKLFLLLSFVTGCTVSAVTAYLIWSLALTDALSDTASRILSAIAAGQLVGITIMSLFFKAKITYPVEWLSYQVAGGEPPEASFTFIEQQVMSLIQEKREFENRERLIADAADEIVCCFDKDLRILTVNKSSERYLGYLPAELIHKCLLDLVLSEDMERTELYLKRLRTERESGSIENRLLTKAGKAIDLSWAAEWSESDNCYFASAKDISDQKTLERAKREFVAMIGHDIRVPVGSVLIGVEALSQGYCGQLGENAAKMLGRMENSLRRLIGLINELLDFEKMSAGKLNLTLQSVDLSQIILEALSDVSDFAAKKNIQIDHSIPAMRVNADPAKLARVFLNLISNAIKFSPPESKVSISAKREPDFIEIKVTDNGPGIPAEYQRLIFERYERIESENSAIEGTGLGLAIAKAIVQSHGGMIGVESEPGKGSTFWITLPADFNDE